MPWTKEDYRAGKIEIDPAAGMGEDEAVNFYNRYRSKDAPTGPVQAPGLLEAGGGGAAEGEGLGGPSGAAMAGLSAAAGGGSGSGSGGVSELAPQGAGNPMLGQRIYPVAMKQLAMLPRVY